MTEEHVHEHVDGVPEKGEPQPPLPIVEYEAVYYDKKGWKVALTDIRGFQFDNGIYFLFVMVEGMPVPEVHVLNLSSPEVNRLVVTPVNVIERDV